jgi:hypothetical protein
MNSLLNKIHKFAILNKLWIGNIKYINTGKARFWAQVQRNIKVDSLINDRGDRIGADLQMYGFGV